ncbi:MAG: single-stranded DNA-binding protein [Bacteroidetes bacterium]|nr:single-stranded DNA-binding protein [Bacteroidota bacterium]
MASRSVNKVILIGNLGQDPEVRYTSTGIAVASFSIATNETYKDQQEQKIKERTQWHNIIAWNKLAEICSQYLKRGSKVYIEGKIQYRTFDDKNGVRRTVTEIIADQLVMLDSRGDAGSVTPESKTNEISNAIPDAQTGVPLQSPDEGDLPF